MNSKDRLFNLWVSVFVDSEENEDEDKKTIIEIEQDGRDLLLSNEFFPIETKGSTKQDLEEIGFKFHEEADNLFYRCDLPIGWSFDLTGHTYHTSVLDGTGKKKFNVFFKNAPYDRRAHAEKV